jgi:hypothetical protein
MEPEMPYKSIPQLTDRQLAHFWSRTVRHRDGCCEWQGHVNKHGYGEVSFGRVVYLVHRVAYAVEHGEVPDGLVVDHLCCNRRCLGYRHLEAVTVAENTRRIHLRKSGRMVVESWGYVPTPKEAAARIDPTFLDSPVWWRYVHMRTSVRHLRNADVVSLFRTGKLT